VEKQNQVSSQNLVEDSERVRNAGLSQLSPQKAGEVSYTRSVLLVRPGLTMD
jgi:hypothetical protein